MTDPDVDSHAQALVRRLDEGLNLAGFRTVSSGDASREWKWAGKVGANGDQAEIRLTERFPYGPPEVVLPERPSQASWHRGAGGVLCLWDTHSLGDLPWLEVATLLDRVQMWIENDDRGWTDDEPALDLEAYHQPYWRDWGKRSGVPLLVIDEWSALTGHWFRVVRPNEYGAFAINGGRRPAPLVGAKPKSRRRGRQRNQQPLNGLAIDLGEMTVPLVDSFDLLAALGQDQASARKVLSAGWPLLLVCRYRRLGAVGLIGFWVSLSGGKLKQPYFEVAERFASQRRRAGLHVSRIEDRTVSVLGAGSVGSYVADMLHRSGVRHLNTHDDDHIKPGNLVRHTAPSHYIGAPKTEAVRGVAVDRDPTTPVEQSGSIGTLAAAVVLLRERDLVVDCTGDRLTWQLLLAASRLTNRRFMRVAVEGHGQYARVDICPPFDGSDELPSDGVRPTTLSEREGGCGDAISPTPPTAVIETAAIGARLAIRILAGEPVPPAGERRELFPVAQ